MNEDKVNMWGGILTFFSLVGIFIFAAKAINTKDIYCAFAAVLCAGVFFLILHYKRRIIDNINYKEFKEHWGNFQKRKRNFKNTQGFFELAVKDEEKFSIDTQTWSDLNMDKVFELIDRTITSPGEEMLYKILRQPELTGEKLIERNKVINLIKDNAEIRNKLGLEFVRMGRLKDNGVYSIISKDFDVNYKYKYIFTFLAAAFALSLVTIPVFGLKFIYLPMGFMLINYLQHGKFKRDVEAYISSLGYLNKIINSSNRISKIKCEDIKYYTEILKRTSKNTERIAKQTAGIQTTDGMDIVMELIYTVFLIEERKFFNCINDIRKYRKDLKELYNTLGELDALMSVASYREWLDGDYVEPEFLDKERFIETSEIYHPLIEEAVSNSIVLDDEGIILTGTNMSGKSTFLRTIGVNALLAQTIYTCSAASYKTSFFKIMTSISPEDNISSGKSYYFREAEALKRIISECNSDYPVLCIIDEIFRGTNPVERVNASAEILNYISKHNTLTLVATHDLELTEMLKDRYTCYYFTEDINEEGLNFDYKLKEGVCKNRNAVKLLKYLKYPEEIIERTNNRLKNLS